MHRNIKLGLFSYSYHLAFGKHDVFQPKDHPPMDLFRFMDRAVELGLDGIQIDPMHLERTDPDYLAQIVAYAGQRNLYIEYGTTGIEAGHLLEQLRIAHELGSPILRTYIGFNPREVADVQQEVTYALAQLEQVKPRAEEYRIKIAIENRCDLKTDELLDLVQRANSPFIGVCVDLGNFMIHLETPTESVKRLAPLHLLHPLQGLRVGNDELGLQDLRRSPWQRLHRPEGHCGYPDQRVQAGPDYAGAAGGKGSHRSRHPEKRG